MIDESEIIVSRTEEESNIKKYCNDELGYSTDCESYGSNSRGGSSGFTPTVTLTNESWCAAQQSAEYVRPILVGYAFGKKKMSTMGMIMAEASMELSLIK